MKKKKNCERERETNDPFVWENYAQNGKECQIYNKSMRIKRVKIIKKDKWTKLYVKLKLPKLKMYRQYFCFEFSLIYYLIITPKLKQMNM